MRFKSCHAISENDRVILRQVTDEMVSGLPAEEVEFLRSMTGKTVVVSEVNQESIEVMATDPATGTIHFLWITGDDVTIH